MKPGFALSLSVDGISLLQRAAGGWRSVGKVSPAQGDLIAGLAGLRDKARALGSGELHCKVIIPNDQIRYISIDTGSFSGAARTDMVRDALAGATPYPVDDLAFDISEDGTTTHVAAVAHETLAEAESFAVEHGFSPLCFVAAPGDNPFLGEPFFGPSAHMATLPGDAKVEADGIAVVVIGPAEVPKSAPDPAPEPEPEPLPEPETTRHAVPPAPELPLAGFSSRRHKPKAPEATAPGSATETAAPLLGGAKRDPDAPIKPTLAEPTPVPVLPPVPVSVTAPTLDIPDETTGSASRLGNFLSRRRKSTHKGRAPLARPTAPPTSPPPSPPIAPTAVSRPADTVSTAPSSEDETARMTVFGARSQAKVGGKPRHLGLMLSVILLLFLAAVAAWASLFLEDGVAGLFRASPAKTELAAAPGTPGIGVKAPTPGLPELPGVSDATDPVPPAETPTTLALLPSAGLDISGLPPPRRITQPAQPAQPDTPNLSGTDSAVLDALRQPDHTDDPATAPPPVVVPVTAPQVTSANPNAANVSASVSADISYAVTGIWQHAPQVPDTPSIIGLDDLYVASIDRTDLSQDAVALPTARSLATDQPFGMVSSPVAAGTAFDLDPRGLVVASVGGTLNPDGVMVYLGRPAVVPPAVPTRFATTPETQSAITTHLAGLRPRQRPNGLEERFERSNLGGLTRDELSGLRPKARPESHQQEADPDQAPTAQAVVSSRIPKSRPDNFAAIVSAAVRPETPDSSGTDTGSGGDQVAARTVTPSIPSSASVARQATMKNEINLRRVNLIGVYGTPSSRRALVRLPSGRYKKVKVGDTVDGGRIVAIGDSELRYQKSGRNLTLKIPSS